jgi:hypothetical protein
MTRLLGNSTGFAPGRIHHWIRLVFALASFAALPLRAASFSTSLDHDTILLGDTATLSLKFEDGQPGGTPQLPALPGLQVVSSGQSSQFGFSTGGRSTSSVTYSYGVRATQIGDFTIPALTVKLGNDTLSSQPIHFKVVRAATPQPGSETEQQSLALLRLSLPRANVYVGETIVVEMQLLVRSGVQNVNGLDVPPLQPDGCTAGKSVQGQQRQTVLGSTPFTVVPFFTPLTVLKPGKLAIGPVDGTVVVELPPRGRGSDPFDPFGMFNRGAQQRVAISAPAPTLNVLPLPETGKPATFTGAVGTYQMAVQAGPTNVAVGDPITIRVQINGHGALDSFTLPDLAAWKEFKTYPPTAKTETTGDFGLDGTKTFEQVVVPQNTEIKELPPLEFSYFNPERRAYQTLRQPALPIIVRPSGASPTPSAAIATTTPENTPAAQDIVHIKPRLGAVTHDLTPWVERPWFLALQALPFCALFSVIIWRKRADSLANNPRLRRQRQVAQWIQDGLGQLRKLAAEQNSGEFFATVFRLMQEQIGERLDLPASAITEAIVEEKLRVRGLPDTTADALHELFQQCNQARYAPVQSAQQLEAVIPRLKTALRELQEVKG